ncbi:MAG: DUF2946 family protein [Kiloniellaceae bacterium]
MLLVALLAQAPASAEAGFAGYGEICRADGDPAKTSDSTPGHPSGHLEVCPICTASAQNGPADLPQALQLPARKAVASAQRPAPEALPTTAEGRAARSRGPPALA